MEERSNASDKPRSDKGGYRGKPRNDSSRGRSYGSKGSGNGKPYKKRYNDGDSRDGERKSYGDRSNGGERKSYGDRDNRDGYKKPYRKYDDSREGGERRDGERKSYGNRSNGNRDGYKKPYRKYDDSREGGERRDGERKSYGSGDRKSYGDRSNGGDRRSYGDRDNRGGYKKPYRKYDDSREGGEGEDRKPRSYRSDSRDGDRRGYGNRSNGGDRRSNGDRDNRGGYKKSNDRRYDDDRRDSKPYDRRYDDRRDSGYRKRSGKTSWTPREEMERREGTEEEAAESTRDRKFGRRRDGQRADWVNPTDDRFGGRRDSHARVDTISRRDLVEIATTDKSEDFVWAGSGLRHTDSEFFVMEGDPVVHEKFGDGLIVKIFAGKVQVEFEDGKRWFAHPLAMEKGILRRPGAPEPVVEEEPEEDIADLESALDDEMAAVLLAAGVNTEEYTVEVDFEEEPEEDDIFPSGDELDLDLDFDSITVTDGEADLFADVELLTGMDFEEAAGDDE